MTITHPFDLNKPIKNDIPYDFSNWLNPSLKSDTRPKTSLTYGYFLDSGMTLKTQSDNHCLFERGDITLHITKDNTVTICKGGELVALVILLYVEDFNDYKELLRKRHGFTL